ncbi:MAG: hypothetical protein IJY04_10715 [Clostridia bacterium]|nr:hypothetical protein [Clostridia bacterium]
MSKAFSFSIKALAILLAVLTVAYLLPMTVFGEMVAESGSVAESSSGAEDGTETALTPEQLIAENYFKPEEEIPADALCEDTGKRESNVKQFLMSDGSYTMAVYAQNVHYMDENGEWQDIDNTLSDSGSVYANKNARIKFSKKISGNEGIFTLHENNRKITVSLEGAIKKTEGTVTNKVTDHGENATELQKMTALDNLSASVLYADILENTDIEYLLNGSDIKENIIIKAKGEEYVYVFTLSLNNLTARLEGNEVLLCDGDEHVYTIPAPFMLDASGKRSDSVTYALADSGNGKYTLTVTADASWINAEERAFPVIVDPAIEQVKAIEFDAVSIDSANPDVCYDNQLFAGYDSATGNEKRGFIQISGFDETYYETLMSATLGLVQKDCHVDENDTSLGMYLGECPYWVYSYEGVTWNTQPEEFWNGTSTSLEASSADTTTGTRC